VFVIFKNNAVVITHNQKLYRITPLAVTSFFFLAFRANLLALIRSNMYFGRLLLNFLLLLNTAIALFAALIMPRITTQFISSKSMSSEYMTFGSKLLNSLQFAFWILYFFLEFESLSFSF